MGKKDYNIVHGYIVLKDNDNNIIYEGSNMILDAGRQFIYDRVFNLNDTESTASYDFYQIVIGNNEKEPTREELYSEIFPSESSVLFSEDINTTNSTRALSTNELTREFKISFNGENGTLCNINTLGITIKNAAGDVKLFSRIKFDNVPVTVDSQFILSYYLYF